MAELERYVARFPDEAKQVVERNALLGLPATPERAHIYERSPAGGYLTFKSSSYYGYDD